MAPAAPISATVSWNFASVRLIALATRTSSSITSTAARPRVGAGVAMGATGAGSAASRTVKVEPWSSWLSTVSVPARARTMP
jgi:hypothetical protein